MWCIWGGGSGLDATARRAGVSSPTTCADYRRAVDRHFAEHIADEQRAWRFGGVAHRVPNAEREMVIHVVPFKTASPSLRARVLTEGVEPCVRLSAPAARCSSRSRRCNLPFRGR